MIRADAQDVFLKMAEVILSQPVHRRLATDNNQRWYKEPGY
jgi:hypothetical protein